MIMTSTAELRASAVWWKDLERWVIPSSMFLRRSSSCAGDSGIHAGEG